MNSKPLTVLHIVGGVDAAGGVMHVATELARGAAPTARGFVWKHRDFAAVRNPELFVCKGEAKRTDVGGVSDVAGALTDLMPLLRWIRGETKVILHAHTRLGIFLGFAASRITGNPLVVHLHGFYKRKWLYRALLKWSKAPVVFTSAKTCRYYGFEPNKSIIVMPPTRWPEPASSGAGRKRFVAAGMFVALKNFHLIIEAFSRLTPSGVDAELVLFGRSDQPFRREEQEHIVSLGRFNPAIKIKDHDSKWTSQLTENDVFVHAAEEEAFGIVMLEAFARGCRCVIPAGTFLDDFDEPLRSRGMYRAQPMTVENLQQNMAAAMSAPASSRDLWMLRRAVAKNFSIEQAVSKLSKVYGTLTK